MLIGSKVLASCETSDVEGVIIGGFELEFGDYANAEGTEISLDNVVVIRADDDNKVYRCNGWLWSFETVA